MNKKIFVTIFILIILCVSARAARKYDVERGNDKKHIDAARQISVIEGVESAAVLSCDGRVLAGIRLLSEVDGEEIFASAEAVLKNTFPKAKEFSIFTDDENARKVVELSLCLETNMKKKLLLQRFDFLMEQKI